MKFKDLQTLIFNFMLVN